MLARILIGIIPVVVGFFLTKKPNLGLDTVGSVEFAEKYISGGSRSFYKLFGIILITIGFLIITNLHVGILNWFASLFIFN